MSATAEDQVNENNSKKRPAKKSNINSNAKMARSLADLSQTVQENFTKIEALSALPEAINNQSKLLKNLMATICQPNIDDGDSQSQQNEGQSDPVAAFMSNVLGEDSPLDNNDNSDISEMNPIVEEILLANVITQECGPPLNEKVANAFKSMLLKPHTKEDIDKAKAEFKIPSNAIELGAPKVNPEIWQNLNRRAQTVDAAQQFIQQSIGRSLIAQAKTAQILFENANKIPGDTLKLLLNNVMDGAAQNANAHREISMKRRQSIKPHLAQDCAGICNNTVPITEFLFGSNLDKDLSLAKSSSKIMRTAANQARGNSYRQPFNNPSFQRRLNFNRPPPQRGFARGGRSQFRGRFPNHNQQ